MKTLLKISTILLFLSLTACASKVVEQDLGSYKKDFAYKDKSGSFLFKRESGAVDKGKNLFAVKQTLLGNSKDGSQEVMERSVVMSRAGSIKGKIPILRPEKSEYSVWFDGQEYSTRMVIDNKIRGMRVTLESPDAQMRGETQHPFPQGTGVYCYFSQIVECANAVGFISKAIAAGGGSMNFYIVWEGYPFFQQQYIGLPEQVFSSAKLTYDGESEQGLRRLSLSVGTQLIFYQLDKSNNLKAIFWPAQGMSVDGTGAGK